MPSPDASDGLLCARCDQTYRGIDGSYDFAGEERERTAERAHYELFYGRRKRGSGAPARESLNAAKLARRWSDPHWPECPIILRRLGKLDGKVVLCLGNGSSLKELHFLDLGATLIHSDLSLSGPLDARARYDLSPYGDRAAFHAIDAYSIPLADDSVDVVYGFEFVHHLPDVPRFLDEARRVLKPRGTCIFFDHAYSGIWQIAKRTILWPLMKFVHVVYGISPEDIRATYGGGYREEDLRRLAEEHGFTNPFFERTTFFHYLFTNGVGKLLGWERPIWIYKAAGRIGRFLDALLTDRVGFLSRSRIEMVWGFEKPPARLDGGAAGPAG